MRLTFELAGHAAVLNVKYPLQSARIGDNGRRQNSKYYTALILKHTYDG